MVQQTYDFNGKTVTVRREHFYSATALATWVRELRGRTSTRGSYYDRGSRGIQVLEQGSTEHLAEAQRYIDQINTEIPTLRKVWKSDVAGFFPNVPAYLAGEPENMWRMDSDESSAAPIRVWVGVGSSAAFSERDLIKRGAILAAFAMALSERRPVLLTPYWQMGDAAATRGSLISWDLQSSPLVLSEVMGCLSDPLVIRDLGLDTNYRYDRTLETAGYWMPGGFEEKRMREYLGCDEQDVWLPALHLLDTLMNNPVEWVRHQIARHLGEASEDVISDELTAGRF